MLEWLHSWFGAVCGQFPGHTWAPGGVSLPVCQRCTGVYVGACVAVVLQFWRRPPSSASWLWLNGAFLLFMVPCGFHWILQNAELRCASGVLFGFGLVSFLVLTVPRSTPRALSPWASVCGIAVAIAITPILGAHGGAPGAWLLTLAIVGGAAALAVLCLYNLFCALRRWTKPRVATA